MVAQDGNPTRMRAADLDGDDREELIVVNFRNARLDVYTWNNEPDDAEPTAADIAVNELPIAPELSLTEIPVRQPPADVAVLPAQDKDQSATLLVLVADPNRLIEFARDEGAWEVARQWDLQAGRLTGGDRLMHLLPGREGEPTRVIVSYNEGIQIVAIGDGSAGGRSTDATWLEPRESPGRNDWWLADLDGDGSRDLVEWTGNARQSVRWYAGSSDGFRPAQALHDRAVTMASVIDRADAADELLLLETNPEGVVRRYQLGEGEPAPLGRREPLALPGGEQAVWTRVTLDGEPHLVVADPNQPRVTLYAHGPSGWVPGESYPVSGKVEAMQALPADPGALVLWTQDSGDLHGTRWDGGRLTYPQPIGLAGDAEVTQVLGLGPGTGDVWCIQKSGDDLLSHRITTLASPNSDEPEAQVTTFRYADTAGKAENVLLLDDARLLAADKFTKGLRFIEMVDLGTGEAKSSKPKALAKATLDDFRLSRELLDNGAERVTVGRITDGVVQWLDDQLNPTDQVMLPDGRRIADFVRNDDGSAWVLPVGGGALLRLTPDDAGVLRVESTTRLDGGERSLWRDEALGLILRTGQGVTRLTEGAPLELQVAQSLDARAGRPEGVRDATIHRVMSTDIDGDGQGDAVFADDVRHQLTALSFDGEGQLTPLLSWPVFEDIAYPYGGGGEQQVREPRRVVALDFDGDGRQDLALLSHDRLLIYLGQDPTAEVQP